MKEEQLKKILQKSTLETSDDFTEMLLQKVATLEEEPSTKVISPQKIFLICLCGLLVLSFVAYTYFAPFISELSGSIKITKTPIFAVFLGMCLLGISYVWRLHQAYRKLL
jgi:glucan phosphoethanolaminetransferase (alkaline phosphatase superfamily)